MRFLIITHTLHKQQNGHWFAYTPYVNEMNLWLKHVDEVEIIAPKVSGTPNPIETVYKHDAIRFTPIPAIAFINVMWALKSVLALPVILFKLIGACKRADYIHLRCPGNIGLLGCLVQILFPKKTKTAKYAGNWDPGSKQPLSYRFQKKILSHTSLTRNMTVLVYGNWEKQTKNIKSFFTATYKQNEKVALQERSYSKVLQFVFIGSLVAGKRPLFAIQLVEALYKQGKNVILDVYGDGILKAELQEYIMSKALENIVFLHGNQPKTVITATLEKAHFSILASKSEGWPKAIAEAMFFGVIPVATSVSCVPDMLGYNKRGILVEAKLEKALQQVNDALDDKERLKKMSKLALNWSQQYTLDAFEAEVIKLLK